MLPTPALTGTTLHRVTRPCITSIYIFSPRRRSSHTGIHGRNFVRRERNEASRAEDDGDDTRQSGRDTSSRSHRHAPRSWSYSRAVRRVSWCLRDCGIVSMHVFDTYARPNCSIISVEYFVILARDVIR